MIYTDRPAITFWSDYLRTMESDQNQPGQDQLEDPQLETQEIAKTWFLKVKKEPFRPDAPQENRIIAKEPGYPRLWERFVQFARDYEHHDFTQDRLLACGMRDWGKTPFGAAAHDAGFVAAYDPEGGFGVDQLAGAIIPDLDRGGGFVDGVGQFHRQTVDAAGTQRGAVVVLDQHPAVGEFLAVHAAVFARGKPFGGLGRRCRGSSLLPRGAAVARGSDVDSHNQGKKTDTQQRNQ